jgi:hypothetical protein
MARRETGYETFVERWSRRKSAAADQSAPAEHDLGSEGTSLCREGDDRVASSGQTELPSDFSQFVRDGIDEVVQRLALRRLWQAEPVFGASDGLDVYCGDYSCVPQTGPAAGEQTSSVKRWTLPHGR